jgi:AraC-like DNA-binding protein
MTTRSIKHGTAAKQSTQSIAATSQLLAMLRGYIIDCLPRAPRLSDAADVLHISSRTLQRLLQQQGSSFRLLVTDCRHRLAQQYLHDHSLSLQQIAYQLGFEEQSSFQKAFKCWQGCSPGAFRQHKLPQAGRTHHFSAHNALLQVNYGIN